MASDARPASRGVVLESEFVAFVVLRDGATLDETRLKDFIRDSLARIDVPAEIRSLDVLPTNGVGKTDRKSLRNMLAAR